MSEALSDPPVHVRPISWCRFGTMFRLGAGRRSTQEAEATSVSDVELRWQKGRALTSSHEHFSAEQ